VSSIGGLWPWLIGIFFLACVIVIFYGSVRPQDIDQSSTDQEKDNISRNGKLHIVAYGILSISIYFMIGYLFNIFSVQVFGSILLVNIYGVLIEVVQKPLETRFFSYKDMMLNFAGSISGVGTAIGLSYIFESLL